MKKTEFKEKPTIGETSMCIEVDGKHDVVITRTDEGVVVDVFQLPYNVENELADDADATCYSFDKETEDA